MFKLLNDIGQRSPKVHMVLHSLGHWNIMECQVIMSLPFCMSKVKDHQRCTTYTHTLIMLYILWKQSGKLV